jgi:hypothetical protein
MEHKSSLGLASVGLRLQKFIINTNSFTNVGYSGKGCYAQWAATKDEIAVLLFH